MAITKYAVLIGFIADESLHTFWVVGAVDQSRFEAQMHSDRLSITDSGYTRRSIDRMELKELQAEQCQHRKAF
jgi:hypothetical protein